MTTGDAIEVTELSKTFLTVTRRPGLLGGMVSLLAPKRVAKTAVDNISFTVRRGELVALLGPNGAGKSTTIKMLTGILVPTSGTVRVAGIEPHRERERNARTIGAVFGQRTQMWWDLPARESFMILRDIYDVPADEHRRRLSEFDDLLGLSGFWHTSVRHLSLGQRVRCDLAAALLHDPMIVFLDEPTIGMDVEVKEQVREFLSHQVERRGRTVVLTTHDMAEVNRLAERVILINHGRLVFDGTLAELRDRFGSTWRVHVTLATATDDPAPPGLRLVRRDGPRVVFTPDGEVGSAHEALRTIIERYDISDIAIEHDDLEDVMRCAYRHHRTPGGTVTVEESG